MNHIDDAEYIRLGKKAREQSLRFAIENLQMQLDELLREGKPKLGRPPKPDTPKPDWTSKDELRAARSIVANKSYWAKMTPEQRSEEIKHRMLVRDGKAKSRAKQLSRRKAVDVKHPSPWAGMSAAERSAEMKRRYAVRTGKAPSRNPQHMKESRKSRAKLAALAAGKPNGAAVSA